MPSWLSASSASFPLPLSESREIGITGFAAIIALAGASGAGLGEGFGAALTGVCSVGPADLMGLVGLAAAFAGAAFAAGFATGFAAGVREETGLLLATGFFAGAAFLAGSAFFTDFLAFVAFADGFFAAIERASAPTDCRLLGRS